MNQGGEYSHCKTEWKEWENKLMKNIFFNAGQLKI